jgi:hypothetical protein
MEFQICKVCLLSKQLTIDNFSQGSNKRNGVLCSYWYKTCKDCDKDRLNKKSHKYKEKNRKSIAIKQTKYHALNKEQDSNTKKQWYQNNKEAVKARVKKNTYTRRSNDSIFRMKESISSNIRSCIKKNRQSFFRFLQYSIDELKKHLEKQFESWMSWNNYGIYCVDKWKDDDQSTWTWQIDHIVPHSKFMYTSMEDDNFKKCWALENLRPYSAKQNIIDGNRR